MTNLKVIDAKENDVYSLLLGFDEHPFHNVIVFMESVLDREGLQVSDPLVEEFCKNLHSTLSKRAK